MQNPQTDSNQQSIQGNSASSPVPNAIQPGQQYQPSPTGLPIEQPAVDALKPSQPVPVQVTGSGTQETNIPPQQAGPTFPQPISVGNSQPVQPTSQVSASGLQEASDKPLEVDFPPRPTSTSSQASSETSESLVQISAQSSKKILIVEDEIPLRKALARKLAQEGYLVTEAENGKDGLNKASAERPDLIITDIVMPDMDGLNMIKNIRESDWGKDIHIILITNLNNSDDVATALQYNVIDYLVKSDMKLKDIIDKVNEKLSIQS